MIRGQRPLTAMTGHSPALLNYVIRPGQDRWRDGDAKRLGGLKVDHELELGRLLYRKVGAIGTLQDLVHAGG